MRLITLSALPIGANGRVLKVVGGLPAWGIDTGGSGGGGAWATTTDDLAIFPADTTHIVLIGNDSTTTTGNILEVTGNALFRNQVSAYQTVTAPNFVATSSAASNFPYASSTALTVSGEDGYFGTASTTNLTVSAVSSALLVTPLAGVRGSCCTSGRRLPQATIEIMILSRIRLRRHRSATRLRLLLQFTGRSHRQCLLNFLTGTLNAGALALAEAR